MCVCVILQGVPLKYVSNSKDLLNFVQTYIKEEGKKKRKIGPKSFGGMECSRPLWFLSYLYCIKVN